MYLLICFRKSSPPRNVNLLFYESTPPQNRQSIVFISNSKQQLDAFRRLAMASIRSLLLLPPALRLGSNHLFSSSLICTGARAATAFRKLAMASTRSYLTQCLGQMVSERQFPHKFVNLSFTIPQTGDGVDKVSILSHRIH